MNDIFAQPNLYIADIVIRQAFFKSKNDKKPIINIRKLYKHPILLFDGELPSDVYKNKFIRKNWTMNDEAFNKSTFTIIIENAVFSSKINYEFTDF